MFISFNDKELRTICEDSDYAIEKLGIDVAKQLQNRLTDLMVTKNILALPLGVSFIPEISPINFKMDLCDGFCLFLIANNTEIRKEVSSIDWENIIRIKIIDIKLCKQ